MAVTSPFQLDSTCLPLRRLAAFEQTILEGIQDLLLVLAPDGRVMHASQMCFEMTTLTPEHLVGKHITTFMHHDDLPVFLGDFHTNMLEGTPWRCHHRLRRRDDSFAVFESTLNPFVDTMAFQTTGFFGLRKCLMTIRPYANPSTVLMDSYLDHLTTNIRLVNQLNQLRSETEMSDEESKKEVDNDISVSDAARSNKNIKTENTSIDYLRKAAWNSASHSSHNLSDCATWKSETDRISGDIGIGITAARLEVIEKTGSWATKTQPSRKRKRGMDCDHVCSQCGTKDSPEWRTGPLGKKTLCNACGLRWAKAAKLEAVACATSVVENPTSDLL